MIAAPGRQTPRIATKAPIQPRKRSPRRMAILVAFSPGRLWLMESSSTNSLSSTQWRLLIRLLRRYGTTPPKLVAPMMRNSIKMSRTVTFCRAAATSAASFARSIVVSLMALRCISFQAVYHCRFGHAEREPILHRVLQGKVERRYQLLLFLRNIFSAGELNLERELSDQRGHRGSIHLVHLARSELAVVRVKDAISADPVLQREDLGFELDAVDPGNLGTHIHGCRLGFIGVTELEHDFGIAHRKAIHVGDAASQDEGVVV